VNGSINTPLRGAKGDVYEGGVRVPFLVSWPGRLPSGRDYAEPVSSVDVFATALALAGAPMPTDRISDSVNILPFLTGENSGSPHDRLFWRTSRKLWAVREGTTKLVRQTGKSDELFDLATDIGETNDLAAAKSEVTKRLGKEVDEWNKELIEPVFPGLEARIQKRTPKKPKPSSNP
jgi:arylsulfatase A-like enzyme